MAQPPIVDFSNREPLQGYYVDGAGDQYSVARLIDEASRHTPFDIPLAALALDAPIWKNANITLLAYHVMKVMEADLKYPIILDWNGEVADGRHRIIKALTLKKRTIKAVRLSYRLTPCKEGE